MADYKLEIDSLAIERLQVRGNEADRYVELLARRAFSVSQGMVPQPGKSKSGKAATNPARNNGQNPYREPTGALKASGAVEPGPRKSWDVVYKRKYAIYVERGTRKMIAQPFLIPSMLAVMGRDAGVAE